MSRPLLLALVAGLVAGALTSPTSSAATIATEPLRVMVVGDSVTQGSAGDWTWRYRLWQEFRSQGAPVDFVGPRDDLFDNVAQTHGSQDYLDPDFDRDHAAKWGAALDWQERRVDDLTQEYHPDVIVVVLGINNLTYFDQSAEATRDSLRRFVASARSVDPSVDVVLGEAAQWWARPTVPLFNTLVDDLADELPRTAAADTDGAFTESIDTWDGMHASASGEVKIAAAVTDALAELGHLEHADRPLPAVVNGPRRKPVATGRLDGTKVHLSWTLPAGATGARVWERMPDEAWTPVSDEVDVTASALTLAVTPARHEFAVQPVKGRLAAAPDAYSATVVMDATPKPLPVVTPPTVTPPTVTPPTVTPPAGSPRSTRATRSGRRLVVRWAAGPGATRYRIFIRSGSGAWRAAGWSVRPRWTSRSLTAHVRYSVKIQSYRGKLAGGVGQTRKVRL